MKRILFFAFICLLCTLPTKKVNASCNIDPIAQGYLNDAYNYVNLGFEEPTLIISNDALTKVVMEKVKEYGNVQHSKGFMASRLDFEQNNITIYSHIFDEHASCDNFVTQKLKRLVVHEYTHHLDQTGYLSKIIHAKNMEATAITGENILPKMVWGKRNPMVLRELNRNEKKGSARLRRFIFRYKN